VSWSQLEALALAAAGGLAIVWCIASLWFPFGWDQGIMAAVGDQIVRGGMPYRDGWDMKGPLAFYLFAAVQWIFGRHMWPIRILDVLLLLVAAGVLGRMVARITSPRTGLWVAVALVLWHGSLSWFFLSQPDGWVAVLMVMAVAPLAVQSDKADFRALVWCGLLIGCCGLIKPFYAAFGLVPVVFALSSRESYSRRILGMLAAGIAAIVPVLAALAWFIKRGALNSLIEVHFSYARAYSGWLGPEVFARRIYNYFWSNGVPTPAGAVAVVLPAIGFGGYILLRQQRRLGLVLLTWLGVALFCVAIQGKFWVYHWTPTFPPFAALAGIGLWNLSRSASSGIASGLPLAVFSALLFFGQVAASPTVDVGRWLQFMTGMKTRTQYYSQYVRRFYVASDTMEASAYLKERTSPSDTIAVWGNEATINYLSERQNPTRFVFAMPLTAVGSAILRANYRKEYMAAFNTHPPRYFVVGQPHDGSPDKAAVLREFPELDSFVRDHYSLERQFGFLDLYRLAETRPE